ASAAECPEQGSEGDPPEVAGGDRRWCAGAGGGVEETSAGVGVDRFDTADSEPMQASGEPDRYLAHPGGGLGRVGGVAVSVGDHRLDNVDQSVGGQGGGSFRCERTGDPGAGWCQFCGLASSSSAAARSELRCWLWSLRCRICALMSLRTRFRFRAMVLSPAIL